MGANTFFSTNGYKLYAVFVDEYTDFTYKLYPLYAKSYFYKFFLTFDNLGMNSFLQK